MLMASLESMTTTIWYTMSCHYTPVQVDVHIKKATYLGTYPTFPHKPLELFEHDYSLALMYSMCSLDLVLVFLFERTQVITIGNRNHYQHIIIQVVRHFLSNSLAGFCRRRSFYVVTHLNVRNPNITQVALAGCHRRCREIEAMTRHAGILNHQLSVGHK